MPHMWQTAQARIPFLPRLRKIHWTRVRGGSQPASQEPATSHSSALGNRKSKTGRPRLQESPRPTQRTWARARKDLKAYLQIREPRRKISAIHAKEKRVRRRSVTQTAQQDPIFPHMDSASNGA